jgi:signal peptidase I
MSAWIPLTLAVAAALLAALGVTRRLFVVVRVVGGSMLPAFNPEDRVLVRRVAGRKVSVGDVAVLAEPRDTSWRLTPAATPRLGDAGTTWVIKRVAAVPGDAVPESVREAASRAAVVPDGMLVVLSDDPGGHDSRSWGLVPAGLVLGSVVMKVSPRRLAGPDRRRLAGPDRRRLAGPDRRA